LSPCPVRVTTRIIIFLMKGIPEDPYKPSFGTGILGGGGGNPKDILQIHHFDIQLFIGRSQIGCKNWGM